MVYGNQKSNKCFEDINYIIITALKSAQNVIINDKHCFQLYRFDILLDSNCNPWLIQINASPSLSTTTKTDRQLKLNLLRDTFEIVIPEDWGQQNCRVEANTCTARQVGDFMLLYDQNQQNQIKSKIQQQNMEMNLFKFMIKKLKYANQTLKELIPNYKEHLWMDQKNVKKMIATIKELKLIGFNTNDIARYFKHQPKLLLKTNSVGPDLKQLINYLKQKFPKEKNLRNIPFRFPGIVNQSCQTLDKKIETLRTLSLTDQQLFYILQRFPPLFNNNFDKNFKDKTQFLNLFLKLGMEHLGKILLRWPFLLSIHQQNLQSNVRFLLKEGFEQLDISQMMYRFVQPFCLKDGNFRQTFKFIKEKIQPPQQQLKKILLKHPRILALDIHSMLYKKYNLFLETGISIPAIQEMFMRKTKIFILSVNSTKLKIEYLKMKLKLDLKQQRAFPTILQKNYSHFLKPRGQLSRTQQVRINWENALNMSDEEFAKQYNIPFQLLEKIQKQTPYSPELDYHIRFYTHLINNLHPQII